MREIKFRAFYKNKMWNVESIDFGHNGIDLRDEQGKGIFVDGIENVILMQFTGLIDKNGKEIYEGDILDISCYVKSFKKKRKSDKCILQLKYCDGVYNLFSLDGSIPYTCVSLVYGINPKQTEVIGNIYDAELLETS